MTPIGSAIESQYLFAVLALSFASTATALGCYRCESRNATDPNCHDKFNSDTGNYDPNCSSGRKDYEGLMPAHFCYKIKGEAIADDSTLKNFTVRDCSLSDMGNMCGIIKVDLGTGEGVEMRGCIKTCRRDGCNSACSAVLSALLLIYCVLHLL